MTKAARGSALVVEDEPLIRLGVVDLCEEAGLEVHEAGSADEAIALLSSGHVYSLIHTDIDMPGSMDGIELAWRAREIIPDIALIVVSGKVIAAQSTLPFGARFFTKPVQDSHLLGAIADLLVTRDAWA